MDKPPWVQAPDDGDALRLEQRARAMWLVLVAVTLSFAGAGLQRDTVSIGGVEVSPDGRTLALGLGTCHQQEAATVYETSSEVRIRARADRAFCGRAGCAAVINVKLQEPLG